MFTSRAALLIIGLVLCTATGCSMCCGVYDYSYPAFGGKFQRADPEYGRVGSIYSDPMADPGIPALTNTQVPVEPRTNPMDLDEDNLDSEADDATANTYGGSGNYNQPQGSGWR